MAADIFGMEESSRFASALANQEGIRVRQESGSIVPYTDTKGSIHIGVPSIYNHEEYMSQLHREISKQVKQVKYFDGVTPQEGSLQDACKDLVQTEVSERCRHGVYEGRDRILQNQYAENLRSNGGINAVINDIAEVNPTIAAVMFVNNELRNDWQGYNHCKPCPAIQDELDRLGFLEEEWKSLETEEDLRVLLHRIEFEEPPEQPPSGGEGDDGDGNGDSEGEGGNSGEGSPDSGEQSGDSKGESQGDDGKPEDGSEPEDGTPDQGDETSEPPQPPAEEDEGSTGDQRDPDEEGGDKQGNNPGIGAAEGSKKLADMGLVKKPVKAGEEYFQDTKVPYEVDQRLQEVTVSKLPPCTHGEAGDYYSRGNKSKQVKETLGSFTMSRKIKKYLLTMKQTGYEYGKKRGKLCSKNVAKLFTGSAQPAIFKQRQASKIQQDTAMFILGDCSGSMSGSKYYTSAAAQIAMSEVLQALHLPHMMMQFTTDHGKVHYIMKGFEERFVSRDILLERYGHGDISMGCNADGEAVTRAAQLLAMRPEKNKVLIVLSDGSPAHGRNSSVFLKDTVASIEASRVMDIIGIGIEDDNVERFYKSSKVINDVRELEPVLLRLLQEKVLR